MLFRSSVEGDSLLVSHSRKYTDMCLFRGKPRKGNLILLDSISLRTVTYPTLRLSGTRPLLIENHSTEHPCCPCCPCYQGEQISTVSGCSSQDFKSSIGTHATLHWSAFCANSILGLGGSSGTHTRVRLDGDMY